METTPSKNRGFKLRQKSASTVPLQADNGSDLVDLRMVMVGWGDNRLAGKAAHTATEMSPVGDRDVDAAVADELAMMSLVR